MGTSANHTYARIAYCVMAEHSAEHSSKILLGRLHGGHLLPYAGNFLYIALLRGNNAQQEGGAGPLSLVTCAYQASRIL